MVLFGENNKHKVESLNSLNTNFSYLVSFTTEGSHETNNGEDQLASLCV